MKDYGEALKPPYVPLPCGDRDRLQHVAGRLEAGRSERRCGEERRQNARRRYEPIVTKKTNLNFYARPMTCHKAGWLKMSVLRPGDVAKMNVNFRRHDASWARDCSGRFADARHA